MNEFRKKYKYFYGGGFSIYFKSRGFKGRSRAHTGQLTSGSSEMISLSTLGGAKSSPFPFRYNQTSGSLIGPPAGWVEVGCSELHGGVIVTPGGITLEGVVLGCDRLRLAPLGLSY